MEAEVNIFDPPKTKQCPFCAETIQAAAIKCRFCNEFLNTNKARAAEAVPDTGTETDTEEPSDGILFAGRPSLWGMAGTVIQAIFFLGIAVFISVYPLETLPWFKLSDNQALAMADYRIFAALALALLVVFILLYKVIRLKMTYYEVSADRIEYSRGILDRRVDNLDMFRVIDLKLRRSLLDCIVGVGTVGLITTDKTDPEFDFEKIRNARRLYDVIKNASLGADQKQRVFHLE